jgi:glutamate-1-semialdehyde 2,1-aminomutase
MTLPHQFVYGRYNDIEFTRSKIDIEIGTILLEPMLGAGGYIIAEKPFLEFLRQEATRIGAVLIFDEVITSRLAYGGLQSHFGVVPDMTTLGKHFGGGFSFGAFGGKKEIMDLYEPGSPHSLYHSGTWNNNLFSMTAGLAGTALLTEEALDRINRLGDKMRRGLIRLFTARDQSVISVVGFGSLVGLLFHGPNALDWKKLFYFYMLKKGIYPSPRGTFSLNLLHQQEHTEKVLEAVDSFIQEFQP